MEKAFRRNITRPVLHNRVFKRIYFLPCGLRSVCTKLSEDGKLTVKKGRTLSSFFK